MSDDTFLKSMLLIVALGFVLENVVRAWRRR